MNTLKIDNILSYYDVPQIFVAKDIFSTKYLCLLYDNEEVCKYTGIKISNERLNEYTRGKIDLRSVFTKPEDETYFDITYDNDKLNFSKFNTTQLTEDKLPEPGFYNEVERYENITLQVPVSDRNIFAEIISRFGWACV